MGRRNNFLLNHWHVFCDNATIHGLRHISEKKSYWFQSLIWTIVVGLSFIFCCSLMLLMWNRFQTDPTIIVVQSINYPIWNVPFPAVTICNPNKIHGPNMVNMKKILNNISDERTDVFFKSLSNLIIVEKPTDNFTDIFNVLKMNAYDSERIMYELMLSCSNLLTNCTWMEKVVNCEDLFKTVKTDEGFCCSFNYHHSNESFDNYNNLPSDDDYKNNVLHISGAGIHSGLGVIVNVDSKNWISPIRTTPSVSVHIHNSFDYPKIKMLGTLVEKGNVAQLPVGPSVLDTTDDVKSLHYTKRKCLFDEEGILSIGKHGYENCIEECRMNAIVDLCGCIPFYYNVKKYAYKKNVRFCDLADNHCRLQNQRKLYTLYSQGVQGDSLKCDCLPSCDVNWYSYTSDKVRMYENEETISLNIYFNDFSCIKYQQSNLNTWDGLFASFGGIFGLCLGGSILSIIEILYHFTIRLYLEYRRRNSVSDVRKIRKKRLRRNVFFINNKKY